VNQSLCWIHNLVAELEFTQPDHTSLGAVFGIIKYHCIPMTALPIAHFNIKEADKQRYYSV
jgi:hypothetical protein